MGLLNDLDRSAIQDERNPLCVVLLLNLGVEPTHNVAERAPRPAVLWRKGSFGSDRAPGSRFAARMLMVVVTCRQQGRWLLDFLVAAVQAALNGTPAPSLLPAGEDG